MNKNSTNSLSSETLLKILSKRQLNALIEPNRQIWPGQRRPSFTSTVRISKNYPFTTRQSPQNHHQQELQSLPYTVLKKKYESAYPLRTLTLNLKSAALKNTAKVGEDREKPNRSKKIAKILKQKLSIDKDGQAMDNYVIDYMAFNFIGKVIDNPELWKAYVQKRQSPG